LVLELGITKQEAVDGFRYLPEDVKLTNSEGEFLPSVVGLRALPDGTFVENVRVGFHHLLLALGLIAMSYQSLDYDIKQAKCVSWDAQYIHYCSLLTNVLGIPSHRWKKLKDSAEEYAARMFQTFARCKFAKRHLLKQVQHFKPADPSIDDMFDNNGDAVEVDDNGNAVGQSTTKDDTLVRYRVVQPGVIQVGQTKRSAIAGEVGAGEIVVVLEIGTEDTNRVRIHSGWVSIISPTGEELLEDVTSEYLKNLQSMPSQAPHKPDVPFRAWERFHKQWGKADTQEDRHARLVTMQLLAVRNALVHSMKTVFAIRMETNSQM
jgi:hypothetical protein